MTSSRLLATLLLILGACATKPIAPRWSARIEQRSETEFVLHVVGDARVRGEAAPVLLAASQQPTDPRILHLNLLYMPLADRRLLQSIDSAKYQQPVGSATAVQEVVVFSEDHPPAHVPVSSTADG